MTILPHLVGTTILSRGLQWDLSPILRIEITRTLYQTQSLVSIRIRLLDSPTLSLLRSLEWRELMESTSCIGSILNALLGCGGEHREGSMRSAPSRCTYPFRADSQSGHLHGKFRSKPLCSIPQTCSTVSTQKHQ